MDLNELRLIGLLGGVPRARMTVTTSTFDEEDRRCLEAIVADRSTPQKASLVNRAIGFSTCPSGRAAPAATVGRQGFRCDVRSLAKGARVTTAAGPAPPPTSAPRSRRRPRWRSISPAGANRAADRPPWRPEPAARRGAKARRRVFSRGERRPRAAAAAGRHHASASHCGNRSSGRLLRSSDRSSAFDAANSASMRRCSAGLGPLGPPSRPFVR